MAQRVSPWSSVSTTQQATALFSTQSARVNGDKFRLIFRENGKFRSSARVINLTDRTECLPIIVQTIEHQTDID